MQKRNLVLQAAIAGAFGIVGAGAFAATIGPTTPTTYAKEALSSASVIGVGAPAATGGSLTSPLIFAMQGSENYAGRSTAFNVKITLGGGATFGGAPAANGVAAQPFAAAAGGLSVTFTNTNGKSAVWGPSLISGGSGSTFVIVNLAPTAQTASLGSGATLDLGAFGIVGSSVTTGASQTVSAQVIDPVTATVLDTVSGTLANVASGVTVTITANTDAGKFIDVAQNALGFTVGATTGKTAFNAGSIKYAAASGVAKATGTALSNADLSLPTVAIGNTGNVSLAAFNVGLPATATNTNVGDLSHVFVSASNTCNSTDYMATATAAPGATSLTLPNITLAPATFGYVCFQANGTTQISAMTPTVAVKSLTIAGLATNTATLAANTTNLLPMVKNGFSTSLHFLVPAEETTATQSTTAPLGGYWTYVRITNTSGVAGPVYVTVTDDAGNQHTSATAITTLAANASALYTSAQLETAAGMTTAPTGRIRLDINAQFPTGAALSFLVNPNGTLSNMSPNK